MNLRNRNHFLTGDVYNMHSLLMSKLLPWPQEAIPVCDCPEWPILLIRNFEAVGAQRIHKANVLEAIIGGIP